MNPIQFVPAKQRGIISIIVVLAVIAIMIFIISKIFGGINGLLETLGLKRDAYEQKLDRTVDERNEQASDPGNPWSPQFYKNAQAQGHAVTLIRAADADRLADQIWDSVGWIYDTPSQAVGAIKQVPTQAALSFLAERFNLRHDRDLWNWLYLKFDTDEQKKALTDIAHYVERLPKYTR
jgi:predicted PurR-regulated permease PerM